MNKKIWILFLTVLILWALAACEPDEEITASTEESLSGVLFVPDDWWDETDSTETSKNFDATGTTESMDVTKTTEANVGSDSFTATDPGAEDTEQPSQITSPSASADELTEYEKFHAMSGENQMIYMDSFDSIEAFFNWYNTAKAEYEELHPGIEVGDGVIDLGDLIGGSG